VAAQDGLQTAGTVTATTTGAVGTVYPFRATSVKITAATSGGAFLDVTGGVGVLATTSASYPMAPGESVTCPLAGAQPAQPGYYTGFSILGQAGVTSTVRYIARR